MSKNVLFQLVKSENKNACRHVVSTHTLERIAAKAEIIRSMSQDWHDPKKLAALAYALVDDVCWTFGSVLQQKKEVSRG